MLTFKLFLAEATKVDEKWKEERLKGCTCPSRKKVNPKCPIHGVEETDEEGNVIKPKKQTR